MRLILLHSIFLIITISCNQKPKNDQVYQARFETFKSYFFSAFSESGKQFFNSSFLLIDASYFQCAKYYLDLIRDTNQSFLDEYTLIISGNDNSTILTEYIDDYKSKFKKVLLDEKALAKRYDLGLVHMTLFVVNDSSLVNITDLSNYNKNDILKLLISHHDEL